MKPGGHNRLFLRERALWTSLFVGNRIVFEKISRLIADGQGKKGGDKADRTRLCLDFISALSRL